MSASESSAPKSRRLFGGQSPEETRSSGASGNTITVNGGGNEDQPAKLANDSLGFRPYVEAIYSFLKNPRTKAPFTLSIEGDWGIGKSSFMCQLQESLVADKQRTISFNAWRHDKVESMWAAFALHFMKELTSHLSPLGRIKANLRLKWKRFDFIKGWFPVLRAVILCIIYAIILAKLVTYFTSSATSFSFIKDDKINLAGTLGILGSTGLILGGLFFLNKIAEVVGNPFKADLQKFIVCPKYEGNVAFIEEFHRDFEQSLNILTSDEEKIFVFIDDLDRAEVAKATELMQGLNLMISNSKRLIFIIGMDREKIAAGIAAKYKDMLPFLNPNQQPLNSFQGLLQAKDFGFKYLEKFIQLSFQIPVPSGDFIRGFVDSLSDIKPSEQRKNKAPVSYNPVLVVSDGQDNHDFREVITLLAKFFDNNPRKLKQFVNNFRLRAHIANSTGLFKEAERTGISSLTIPQLGKFIALGMLWPEFPDHLSANPQILTRLHQQPGSPLPDQDKDLERWINDKAFMSLLAIKPEGSSSNKMAYSMQNLDVPALIQTSPVSKPSAAPRSLSVSVPDDAPKEPAKRRKFMDESSETPAPNSKSSFAKK